MVTVTACALCPADAARTADAECHACGRATCASHMRALFGLCRDCATDEGLARMTRAPEKAHPRDVLGIKWIE